MKAAAAPPTTPSYSVPHQHHTPTLGWAETLATSCWETETNLWWLVGGLWVVSAGALLLLYYPLPTPEACTIIGCHPPTGSFLCVVQSNNLKKGGNELIPKHNVEKISNPTHNKRAAISPAAKSPTQVTTGLGWAGYRA